MPAILDYEYNRLAPNEAARNFESITEFSKTIGNGENFPESTEISSIFSNLCKYAQSADLLKKITSQESQHLLEKNNIAVIRHINRLTLTSFKSQYLYIPIVHLLEIINTEPTIKKKYISVILITDSISQFGGSGSVVFVELCQTFFKLMIESGNESSPESTMNKALVSAFGSLAKRIQYPDQMNDLFSFLVNRLSLATASSQIDLEKDNGIVASPKRKWILECLVSIVNVRLNEIQSDEGKLVKRNSFYGKSLNDDITSPLLSFLGYKDVGFYF